MASSSKILLPETSAKKIISTTKRKIAFLIDISGSMAGYPHTNIQQALRACDYNNWNPYFVLFGNQLPGSTYKNISDFLKNHVSGGCTYTANISAFFNSPESNDVECVVFHGDGDFTDAGIVPIFVKASKDGKFKNLKDAIFTFAHHTNPATVTNLSQQLKSIMDSCPNAINVKFYTFLREANNQIKSLLDSTSTDVWNLPENYLIVYGLYAIHKDITAGDLSHELLTNPIFSKLGLVRLTRDKMLETIKENPATLNTHTLYAKLHKMLQASYRDMPSEYSLKIQDILRNFANGSKEYIALQTLLKDAFKDKDNSEFKKIWDQISPYIIGFMHFDVRVGNMPTVEDIIKLSREKNTSILECFRNAYFKPCNISKMSSTDIIKNFAQYGLPILSEDAPIQLCRLAFQLLFLQIDTCTIPPQSVFLSLIVLLTKEYTFPPEILNFIKRVCFNDESYVTKMLGLKFDDGLGMFQTEDIFYSRNMSGCMSNVLKQYKKEMFPRSIGEHEDALLSKFQIESVIDEFNKLYKAHMLTKGVTTLKKKFNFTSSITKTFEVPIGQDFGIGVNPGDVYLLPAFSKDPKKNLPSIVVVWFIEVHTGKIVLMYCDKPMDCLNITTSINGVIQYLGLTDGLSIKLLKDMGYTFDTRIVYSMPSGSEKLASNVSDVNLVNVHKYLEALDCDESSPGMAPGAQLIPSLLEKNIGEVRKILNPNGTRTETKTITAPISDDIIYTILGIPEVLKNSLKSGSNLNKIQLCECIRQMHSSSAPIPTTFVHNGETFPITMELISEIRSTFDTILTQVMGKPTTLCELSDVTCSTCFDEKSFRDMILYPCGRGHWSCTECNSMMTEQSQLPHGTDKLLQTAVYCCPHDKTFIGHEDPRITSYFTANPQGPAPQTAVRPCIDCDILFTQATACGGNETHLDTQCVNCKPKPKITCNKLMQCPGLDCPVQYFDHDACAHITCENCDTHYCAKCQYLFTPEQLDNIGWWTCLDTCTEDSVNIELGIY